MVLKGLAVGGLGIVAAMHLLFLLTGLSTPSPSLALSAVGLVGALACAWGLHAAPSRAGLVALAAGFVPLLVARGVYFAWGLDEVGVDDVGGALTVAGFLLAGVHAALWAVRPDATPEARAGGVRAGFALCAAGYFVTMLLVVSFGSMSLLFGMLLGAVGYSLAAPNVAPLDDDAGARPTLS